MLVITASIWNQHIQAVENEITLTELAAFQPNERMPSYLSLGAHLQIRDKSVIFHVFTMSQQIYRFWTKANCLSPNCEQKEASFSLKCSMLTESSSKTVKKTRQSAFAKKKVYSQTNIFFRFQNFLVSATTTLSQHLPPCLMFSVSELSPWHRWQQMQPRV